MSCGDNPIFEINGCSNERLLDTLKLACSSKTAIGYTIDTKDNNPRMILFWTNHKEMTPFPGKSTPAFLASFIQMWLDGLGTKFSYRGVNSSDVPSYPSEPDHDGDNGKGWLVYTEGWGHIGPYDYPAFLAIEPHWIMYGK